MNDLVVLSLEPWDEVWRRNQYLVAGLLRADEELRVLFIEPATDPLYDLRSGRRPRLGSGLRDVALEGAPGRLWAYQPTKLLPRRIDPGRDLRWAREVALVARRLGFTTPVLWVNDPNGAAVLQHTGWPALYDITDDWLTADRTAAEHARLVRDEAVLLRECAEVVVCSPGLVASKGPLRPVTLVQNAVDVAAYRVPIPRPVDLPSGPVALYVGTVHTDRVDVEVCVRTAETLAGTATVVLVGPHPLPANDLARLASAGVLLLGPKPREAVPGYLQHADVLLVPHVVTAFTESLDPIKLYEYAAAGRPVVSTPVAGFRDAAGVLVGEPSQFPALVGQVLAGSSGWVPGSGVVADWADRVTAMAAVLARVRRPATPG